MNYISSVQPTRMRRFQLSAIAEMSDGVRIRLSNFEIKEVGSLLENRRSVRRALTHTHPGMTAIT